MADELWSVLLRFHREITFPEIVGTLREEIAAGNRETQTTLDAVWQRLDRLDTEYHVLSAAMMRVESRLASVEEKIEPANG
jgi:hypothetical protein